MEPGMNTQFKKGVLELCVLVMAGHKDFYGYELVNLISENIQISEGTIYPLLRRLTMDGHFSTYLIESNEGPPRKYYHLTELGKRYRDSLVRDWSSFSKGVDRIIETYSKGEVDR